MMGYYLNKCRICKQTIYVNRDDGKPIEKHEFLEDCIEAIGSRLEDLEDRDAEGKTDE